MKWKSVLINNQIYILAVNHGPIGRYETFSQLFKFNSNETLQLVQNITTKGASDAEFFMSNSDVYLLVSNQIDNNDRTNLQTQVNIWDFHIAVNHKCCTVSVALKPGVCQNCAQPELIADCLSSIFFEPINRRPVQESWACSIKLLYVLSSC